MVDVVGRFGDEIDELRTLILTEVQAHGPPDQGGVPGRSTVHFTGALTVSQR